MAENQEQAKPKEREIPVFTVLKNNCILKNIFLLDNPPSIPSSSSDSVPENADQEILVVGRHPDCNIKLEHPSISRFHLRIHSNPAFRSLYVTDLSSVHGTWISGKRIEPEVRIKLNEGDTLHLGASSRLYRLNWVPLRCAYDIDNPFVPHLDASDTADEETDEPLVQDTNASLDRDDRVESPSDNLDGLEQLFSDQDFGSSTQKMSPPLMPQGSHNLFSIKEEVENNILPGKYDQENELSFEIENSTPSASLETMETYEMNSDKNPGESIWSRRGKSKSVQIETSKLRGKCANINITSPVKSVLDENYESESILEDLDSEPDKENTAPDSLPFRSLKSENEQKSKDELIFNTTISSVDRDEEFFAPDKENMTTSPDSHLFRSLESKNEEKLKNGPTLNEPIFRVDQDEGIFTPDKENMTPNSHLLRSSRCKNEEKLKNESILNAPISCVDREEEIFTPDKENMTPYSHLLRSSKCKNEEKLKNELILNAPISSLYRDEEIFTPDKENMTPNCHLLMSSKSKNEEKLKNESILKAPISSVDRDDEIFTPDKENMTPNTHLLRYSMSKNEEKLKNESVLNTPISSVDRDDEIFTPDKENMTPNTRLLRSVKNRTGKNPNSHRSSPLKTVYNRKSTNSSSTLKARENRDPFCPLPVNSPSNHKSDSKPLVCEDMTRGSRSIKYPVTEKNNTMKVAESKWIIVTDTASLLNKKSRNELQLLRGLRGTQLVIPRIVVRELDCMLKRASFFTRTSDVSAALQYIEECMAVAKWWIHVQSSAEEGRLIPPTPPASPHWFGDDMWASSIGSAPFSPCSSLQEIVTPTAADHILEYALYYKRIRKDGQLVLLTDDVTLKIKAMAEGVLCETGAGFSSESCEPILNSVFCTPTVPRSDLLGPVRMMLCSRRNIILALLQRRRRKRAKVQRD